MHRPPPYDVPILMGLVMVALTVVSTATSSAVDMLDDPKGYLGIPWGSSLATQASLKEVHATDMLTEYEPKEGLPHLDTIPVGALKYVSVNGQFARVTVRYRGEAVHKRIMAYLEKRFGPLDKTPGQMVRGLNQQYNWRGMDTEINVTYEGQGERGFVFFDSRTLAPRFNDGITDSSE